MGGAYDVGLQRIAWVIGVLTDWMGDEAHLAEVDVDVLAPNLVGHTTYIDGTITDRWQESENCFVAIELEGRNQDAILTTRGDAILTLPSFEFGAVSLPLFGGDVQRWTTPPKDDEKQEED